jgi:predicted MFS family arabinose efflux permease
MYLFLTASLVAAAWFWVISFSTPPTAAIYAGIALLWGAYGLSTVAIYTTSMDIVRRGREGTDFTLQIVLTHLSSLVIAVMSGKIGDLVGYNRFFAIEILLCLIAMGTLVYALPNKTNDENN